MQRDVCRVPGEPNLHPAAPDNPLCSCPTSSKAESSGRWQRHSASSLPLLDPVPFAARSAAPPRRPSPRSMCAHLSDSNMPSSSDELFARSADVHSAFKHLHNKQIPPTAQAKSLASPAPSHAASMSGAHSVPSTRPSSPQVNSFSTPKTRKPGAKDRAYWSSDHPDDLHRKRHAHHSEHHHAHTHQPYYHYSDNLAHTGRHALSKDNRSLQDLTILNSLVDGRTGSCEDRRASDQFLQDVGKGKKNGAEIRAYYERLNSILDGWREVDEILDSQFPEEVMRRFGTVEEVERMKLGRRKRLPWLEDPSEGEDSGYQEESEVDSDDEDTPASKRGESLTARAASALSGFWFRPSQPRRGPKQRIARDEEAALLGSPRSASVDSASDPRRPGYGAANSFKTPGSALTTIQDSGEVSPRETISPPEDTPRAGAVLADAPDGRGPTALEHDTSAAKIQTKEARSKSVGKRNQRLASRILANSDTDDEMDDTGSESIEPGSLDRKLAAEREERKARSKQRDVVIPGTGGQTARISARSLSSGQSGKQKNSKPGGLSERERIRLLEHVPGRAEKEDERERGASFAININLAVNVLLLAGKAFAVISSNSVSLLASLVDSALDLLSTVIIFGTSKAIAYRSWHTYFKYPVGKKRFEPLGVVIFSVLMIASFCQVLVESSERLWAVLHKDAKEPNEMAQLPWVGVAFMVLTIIVKAFMWVIYRKSSSSGVRAVAQDAENDVVFNVASLIFPVVGDKLGWPALDPIGGVCLSIYIIWEWIETLAETVTKLSGAAASPDAITRALYLITRFKSVDSVSALELYHAGDDMIVEADVVLPLSLALKEAHDLGEIVTYCLESIGQ